ncbi:endopolyphosphatase [Cylindrobasidium torrendii FP15055 ss-10]|uniref:Endopolyphosphatase n=1 Tax=Cylindrobasidium torrendii FP15055 ss-10 TaxID=1314674 RepID=A0A0D7BMM9_9AGAR|nr:endopolyphosphatase [Cylindrobasidium torrendii FP15055 ss-10]
MLWTALFLAFIATAEPTVAQDITQFPILAPATAPRKLHGRFLHITDIHPDPYYKTGTSLKKACHRKKPSKKKNRSKYWGTPYSDCDSPLHLANYTLDYVNKHWGSEIDFVIWTGDNARHDNDRRTPRTPAEIFQLNRNVAKRMEKLFASKGIPVVPSLGNNDLWPHNILTPGPNAVTKEFTSIWGSFIPFAYHQIFQRGAYYSTEVVPGAIAAISLNTLYFYDSNKVVSGCDSREPNDPGNLQFDWLEVQLKIYRSRGMKVWLTGHIPPSHGNYFPECYVRYAELSLRFQDTILGHLYGHMNADHFYLIEDVDLLLDVDQPDGKLRGEDDLCDALLNDFADIPKRSKTDMDGFGVVNVSPSVVPNPYLPSFRVYSYNISGTPGDVDILRKGRKPSHNRGDHGSKEKYCAEKEYKHSWKCILNNTWHTDSDSPSRTNTLWSPLGYAQYYIPDLGEGNKTHYPHFKLEYATYAPAALYPLTVNDEEGMKDKDNAFYPIPLKNLPKSLRKGPVSKSKYLPYGMEDLTIGSWVDLARKLSKDGNQKLRKKFRKYMYQA